MKPLILNHGLVYLNGELKKRNLLIKGEKIVGISETPFQNGEVVNCKGKWILPGCIDPHVHFRCPGMEHKEDWLSGSKAAAAGGVTTVLDMPNTIPATTTVQLLDEKRKIASKSSIVNFGFHFGATSDNLNQIDSINNIASIKVYFGSSTGDLLVNELSYIKRLLQQSRFPIAFHAENESIIQENSLKIKRQNLSHPKIHGLIRSELAAQSAVEEILNLSKHYNTKIYFCHISTQKEVELIQAAKNNIKVYCEITPHHLFLNEEILDEIGHFGKVNPPLRKEIDRAFLYQALLNNEIDTIGSDHAPHLSKEKQSDYYKAPAGMPGIETLLPLLLTEVHHGFLSISQVIHFTSENTSTIFSIENKGKIVQNYDADIIVVNPKKRYKISSAKLFTKAGWTPFEGREVFGEVELTFVLGRLAFNKREFYPVKGKEVLFTENKKLKN